MNSSLKLSRRQVLRLAALGALSAFIAACQRAVAPIANAPAPTQVSPIPASALNDGTVPITQAQDFYITSYSSTPKIPSNWKLTITGLVDKPLALSLDDLKAMPTVTEMRTISCISNPVGGDLIGNAVWKGVRFKDLLAQAGVKSNAHFFKFEAFDGWSTGIPLELGLDDHSLLVYEMNGAPLLPDHGAPLRCFWPGHYGMKQPKWIQTITLAEGEYIGYWERQGWSNQAKVLPFSRFDVPPTYDVVSAETITLSGIAHTDESGLAKLDISWDDTNQWQAAELTRGPSALVWTIWKWSGKSLTPGRHTFYARATDNNGQTQTRGASFNLLGGTYPNGSSDMDALTLDFKG